MADKEMVGERIVALVRDLMFASRVRGAAPEAVVVHGAAKLLEAAGPDTALVIVDLEAPDALGVLEEVRERAPGARVVAFGPHVLEEALERAHEAGAEPLARGAFVKALPDLVAGVH